MGDPKYVDGELQVGSPPRCGLWRHEPRFHSIDRSVSDRIQYDMIYKYFPDRTRTEYVRWVDASPRFASLSGIDIAIVIHISILIVSWAPDSRLEAQRLVVYLT